MKLIKLSCNQPEFRTIVFNPEGLTVILGTKSDNKESSVNGVGKTQSLRLINFCFGAKSTNSLAKTLSHAVPTWIFKLDFEINGIKHTIERSGNSKVIRLDNTDIKLSKLQEWLDLSGVFPKVNQFKFLSFRSLFKRFTRTERSDCLNPLLIEKESDYSSLINNAFLLGLDLNLINEKYSLKEKVKANSATQKLLKQDSYLSEVVKTGANPTARKEVLEKRIPQLEKNLENYSIAEDYHQIEKDIEILTENSRSIQREISALNFKIASINKSIEQTPDISNKDLLDLYSGLKHLFKEEALAHFSAVQKFHDDLTVNRKTKLEKEKIGIFTQIEELNKNYNNLALERDQKLAFLKDKHALDEYIAIAKELSSLQEELSHLKKYLTISDDIKQQNLSIKGQIISSISHALEYLKTDPLADLSLKFQEITSQLYPKYSSGIYITLNDSENNTLMYDLAIELQTDSSDGVANAKIIAYDWLVFMHGFHNMNLLWHDNRFFADIDPSELAKWFKYVMDELRGSKKQYVTSININNYEDIKTYLSNELKEEFESKVVIKLLSDKPKHKLFGIDFDKQRISAK
ncbi:DUF2326 domain-containing protein [Acinetobacter pittii]|uniref:DUF2326 domain-containing protein n=1 Tax=Acinetobacter pittii ANC 4050 TaxID=1217691 RepID=R8YHI7_ACIPI|nr:DUF2326 domain-containing protein [Acinetobacter pittii]EOQ68888.1 hypothetical protein F931_01606 [Acinetobacter pittii ANC 4050]